MVVACVKGASVEELQISEEVVHEVGPLSPKDEVDTRWADMRQIVPMGSAIKAFLQHVFESVIARIKSDAEFFAEKQDIDAGDSPVSAETQEAQIPPASPSEDVVEDRLPEKEHLPEESHLPEKEPVPLDSSPGGAESLPEESSLAGQPQNLECEEKPVESGPKLVERKEGQRHFADYKSKSDFHLRLCTSIEEFLPRPLRSLELSLNLNGVRRMVRLKDAQPPQQLFVHSQSKEDLRSSEEPCGEAVLSLSEKKDSSPPSEERPAAADSLPTDEPSSSPPVVQVDSSDTQLLRDLEALEAVDSLAERDGEASARAAEETSLLSDAKPEARDEAQQQAAVESENSERLEKEEGGEKTAEPAESPRLSEESEVRLSQGALSPPPSLGRLDDEELAESDPSETAARADAGGEASQEAEDFQMPAAASRARVFRGLFHSFCEEATKRRERPRWSIFLEDVGIVAKRVRGEFFQRRPPLRLGGLDESGASRRDRARTQQNTRTQQSTRTQEHALELRFCDLHLLPSGLSG